MEFSEKEFEEMVNSGIQAIPDRFLGKLDNVSIVVEGMPSLRQFRKSGKGRGVLLLGLYEGVPQTARGRYNLALPDKITIFKKSIEFLARSREHAERIVRDTVWHEIAHHFGMDEGRVRAAERKRGRRSMA